MRGFKLINKAIYAIKLYFIFSIVIGMTIVITHNLGIDVTNISIAHKNNEVVSKSTSKTDISLTNLEKYKNINKPVENWDTGLSDIGIEKRIKTLGLEPMTHLDIYKYKFMCINEFDSIKKELIPKCKRFLNKMYEKDLYDYYDDCIYDKGSEFKNKLNLINYIRFCSYVKNFPDGKNEVLIKTLITNKIEDNNKIYEKLE